MFKNIILMLVFIPILGVSQADKNYPICHRNLNGEFVIIMVDSSSTNLNGHLAHSGDHFDIYDANGDSAIGKEDCDLIGNVPVILAKFLATNKGDYVEVNWTTNSEINSSHFILYRSIDMVIWREVAKVEGAGNSSVGNNYIYIDENLNNSTIYYKLVQYDFDGDYEIYGPISVSLDIPRISKHILGIDPLGRVNRKQSVR